MSYLKAYSKSSLRWNSPKVETSMNCWTTVVNSLTSQVWPMVGHKQVQRYNHVVVITQINSFCLISVKISRDTHIITNGRDYRWIIQQHKICNIHKKPYYQPELCTVSTYETTTWQLILALHGKSFQGGSSSSCRQWKKGKEEKGKWLIK